METKCISCKVNIANLSGSVEFPCPKCGETMMFRCTNCRAIAAKYQCANCEFEGPN